MQDSRARLAEKGETGEGSRSYVQGFLNFEFRITRVALGVPIARLRCCRMFSAFCERRSAA